MKCSIRAHESQIIKHHVLDYSIRRYFKKLLHLIFFGRNITVTARFWFYTQLVNDLFVSFLKIYATTLKSKVLSLIFLNKYNNTKNKSCLPQVTRFYWNGTKKYKPFIYIFQKKIYLIVGLIKKHWNRINNLLAINQFNNNNQ